MYARLYSENNKTKIKDNPNTDTKHVPGMEHSIRLRSSLSPNWAKNSVLSQLKSQRAFCRNWQIDPKIYMKLQRTKNSNLKTNESGRLMHLCNMI